MYRRCTKPLNFSRDERNTETQRNPCSYLLEVTHINFAIQFLAEVKKYFSECWVPLLYPVFEFFNHFILGHILGQGASVLSGLGSTITSRHLDPAESFLETSPNLDSTQDNKEAHHPLLPNQETDLQIDGVT